MSDDRTQQHEPDPFPLGARIKILNADLVPPSVGFINEKDGGLCVALLLPDHTCIAFPDVWACTTGLHMVQASLIDLEMIDEQTYEELQKHLREVQARVDALRTEGVVRGKKEALQ